LAAIFAEYTSAKAARERNQYARNRQTSLKRAFTVLMRAQAAAAGGDVEMRANHMPVPASDRSPHGSGITRANDDQLTLLSFGWLVLALNQFWRVPFIDPIQTKIYFQSCDMSNTYRICVMCVRVFF
jgi:hypothetical protein